MTQPRPTPEAEARSRAEAILRGVERDSPGVGESALRKAADHFAGRDAPAEDRIEVWGRRTGRFLGGLFLIVLVLNLFTGWFF